MKAKGWTVKKWKDQGSTVSPEQIHEWQSRIMTTGKQPPQFFTFAQPSGRVTAMSNNSTQHPVKSSLCAQNQPTQIVNRRIRRNAVKQLRVRCRGWGRQGVVMKVLTNGRLVPTFEKHATISEVLLDMANDPGALERFAARKDVGDPEIKLFLLAEGNPA